MSETEAEKPEEQIEEDTSTAPQESRKKLNGCQWGCLSSMFAITAVYILSWISLSNQSITYWRKFKDPLPERAQIRHYQYSKYGFDYGYNFVFQVSDDALKNQIIEQFNLSRVNADSDRHPVTFLSLIEGQPEWWRIPDSNRMYPMDENDLEQFKDIEEMYSNFQIDGNPLRYASLWVDIEDGLLYFEAGET